MMIKPSMKTKKKTAHLCVVNPDTEEKIFQKTAHYGVLLGYKRNMTEFVVSNFIETPPENEKKLLSSPSASWMAAHAIQIKRMLIGGQLIIGFYGIDPVKIKVDGLCEVAINKFKKSENRNPEIFDESTYFWLYGDLLKWTCSQFCMKDNVAIKFIEPEKMQYLTSVWEINLKFVLSSSTPLINQIESIVKNEEIKIHDAISLLDDELIISKQNSPSLVSKKEADIKKDGYMNKYDNHKVTLMVTGIKSLGYYSEPLDNPFLGNSFKGIFSFSGKIISNVCVTTCTKFEAVEAIRRDIANSLRNRFYIWKEGLQNSDIYYNKIPENNQEFKISLPSRVIFSFQNLRLCDYKESHETMQDCELRCQELFGSKEEWQSVLYIETEFDGGADLPDIRSNQPNKSTRKNIYKDGGKTEANKNRSSGSEVNCDKIIEVKENENLSMSSTFNYKVYFILLVVVVSVGYSFLFN